MHPLIINSPGASFTSIRWLKSNAFFIHNLLFFRQSEGNLCEEKKCWVPPQSLPVLNHLCQQEVQPES